MAIRTRLGALLALLPAAAIVAACTSSTSGSGSKAGAGNSNSTGSQTSSASDGQATKASGGFPTSGAPATVTVTPPPPATSASTEPGIFVGEWYGHGRGLVVSADGTAIATYRTYTFCSQDPTPPCDEDTGNVLISGGRVTMKITKVVTANNQSVATAPVVSSNDPLYQGKTEKLTLSGDVIESDFGSFCDDKAPAGTCGA